MMQPNLYAYIVADLKAKAISQRCLENFLDNLSDYGNLVAEDKIFILLDNPGLGDENPYNLFRDYLYENNEHEMLQIIEARALDATKVTDFT